MKNLIILAIVAILDFQGTFGNLLTEAQFKNAVKSSGYPTPTTTKREYACAKTGCPGKYKQANCGAAGKTYYGRGYIQLTWCSNYKAASGDLYGNDRLVQDPDLVARDENVAWQTAFWFWRKNVHSRVGVSQGKFGVTTRAINGGECTNSKLHLRAKKRFQIYNNCRKAFGLSGNGDERGCYN
ncbi:unnamed protein product [Allacma fusca]|uniref:Glycoside hydrolase family 19 catalytic domain-containing protein n=1 Tax=Allacma fusca TaxID=39272 RepID=A0A8J2JCM4_9HEXA|nr:unnamed protein product [Allacma fusca]